MGWEKGKYYTRSHKVKGRVIREYIGKGEVGQLCAEQDQGERIQRQQQTLEIQEIKQTLQTTEAAIEAVIEQTELWFRAVLLAEGYHQHHRGEWRKRRASATPNLPSSQSPSDVG